MTEWLTHDLTPDEEQAVRAFMSRLAAAPLGEKPRVHDPGVLWVKAQLLRRWEAERRVEAPLDAMEPISIAAGLAAAAAVVIYCFPSLLRLLPGVDI